MASLIGGVVGASIGFFVGAPQIGFLVGSMIGGAVDRAMNPVVTEGPRIGDLSVSSSAYGNPKPILYGTARLPGQVIWSSGIKETRIVKKSKGKGGQPTKEVTYQYSSNVALGLCEGPVSGFIRIWMDGKLTYDRDGTGVLSNNRFTLRTYVGDESQLPDGLISQDVGSDVSPAYRGLAYIVLEDLQLEPFGNRLPSITVEVSNNVTPIDYKINVPFSVVVPNQSPNSIRIDRYRELIVKLSWLEPLASDSRSQQLVTVFDFKGNVVIQKNLDQIFSAPHLLNEKFVAYYKDIGCLVIPGEYLYLTTKGAGSRTNLHRLNITTLEVLETFFSRSNIGGPYGEPLCSDVSLPGHGFYHPAFSGYQLVFDQYGEMTPFAGFSHYPILGNNYCTVKLGKSMKIVHGNSRYFDGINEANSVPTFDPMPNVAGSFNNDIQFIPGQIRVGQSDAYWIGYNGGQGVGINGNIVIKKITLTPFSAFDTDSLSNTNVSTPWQFLLGTQIIDAFGSPINMFILSVCYDPEDDTLIFLASSNSYPTYMFKYKFDTNSILWITQIPYNTYPWTRFQIHWSESDVSQHTIGFSDFPGFVLDTRTGAIIYNTSAPSNFQKHHSTVWDSKMFGGYGIHTIVTGVFEKFYFNRATSGTVTLKTIVDDLCRRGGLNPITQIESTSLNSIQVKGYVVARPTTARATLEQLSSAFFIKAVESDGKIKFYLKNSASSALTIPQKWLSSEREDGNFWEESRKQELELPKKITVTHINPDDDYQQGAQFQQRITNPYPSSWGNSEITLEMPMVLYPNEAKAIATNMLYTTWSERISYKSMLPWRYVALDPTDTVTVTMDDGENFGVRISTTNLGANYHIETGFISQDASTYVTPTSLNAGSSLGFVPQEILELKKSRIVFLDIPYLTDQDRTDSSSTRIYFASSPYTPGWPGGVLDLSLDNGFTYDYLNNIIDPIYSGVVSGQLPITSDPNIVDYTTQLIVYMNDIDYELESVSDELFYAGQNVALIGKELIYFKNAVQENERNYIISTIIRGRRGTEWACNSHHVGEEFYLLTENSNSLIKKSLPLSTINVSHHYRLTTFGMYASEAMITQNAFTGAAERPYSPVNINRVFSTPDLNITWSRRNRYNGHLRDSVEIPAIEGINDFDLYILSNPYDIVAENTRPPTTGIIRSYLGLTSETVNYSNSDRFADGFNINTDQLHVVIFQNNSLVGAGFPGFASFEPV